MTENDILKDGFGDAEGEGHLNIEFGAAAADGGSFARGGLEEELAVEGGLFAGSVAGDGELHRAGADHADAVCVVEEETHLGYDVFARGHLP